MDVDMLSPQTKENSSPMLYPKLPSPPANTPPHPHTSSPTWHTPSNVSRKRTPRLTGLTDTPARTSFSQQMLKHWSTSTPKLPQEHIVSGQGDCSPPKDSRISSPDLNEDPLNDLERAVASVIPDSPRSKQRRKTLFIPGPHCRQYDSDDTSEAWTGDEIFLGRREVPRVAKVASGRYERKFQASPLRKCFVQAVEKELQHLGESSSKSCKVLLRANIKAEPDEGEDEAFVTAHQEILGAKPATSRQNEMHMDGNDTVPASKTEDTSDDANDCEDSEKCSSAQESSAEGQTKEPKASKFLDLCCGPLYPKLPESANSTDLDLSPALTTISNGMCLSQENLQKWNKAQLARPRMSRFYHPAAVTRGTCHPESDARLQPKVVIQSPKSLPRLSTSRFQTPVLYSTCHLKTTTEAEPVVEPEHTSSDADDEDEGQVEDATDSPV